MAIMSLRNWLRIPPILIMDELLKTSFGSPHLADAVFPANNDFVNSTLSQIEIGESAQYYKAIFPSFIKIIVSRLIFCSLSSSFVLPARYLHMVYFHLLSVSIVLLSNSANIETLKVVYEKYENLETIPINNLFVNVVDLLEMEWDRLDISCVQRMFWALRVIEQILYLLTDKEMQDETFFGVVKNVFIKGCDTFTAVLGMTSILSYFCHYTVAFFQRVLLRNYVVDKIIGTWSAALFYIIALQTGPTGLEESIINFYRAVCLFCAALLHHIHFVGIPLLMYMSVSYNSSLIKHIRPILFYGLLIVSSIILLTYLWSQHSVSTWLLAVSSFNIQIVIKLLESLAVYSLFLRDARRKTFWGKLDDYVYYIKLSGITVEFFFVIFLFLYGVYITAFVSGGVVHTSMMFIHVNFNIWCDARDGWRLFIKRRTAVKKIESLPVAIVQLSNFKGACAICGRRMRLAKITKCNHYFHGECLSKWLYFKDRCPLCHNILFKPR